MAQGNQVDIGFTCPSCRYEERSSADKAVSTPKQPLVRECVECHEPLNAHDIHCRKCGAKYDIWLTRAGPVVSCVKEIRPLTEPVMG